MINMKNFILVALISILVGIVITIGFILMGWKVTFFYGLLIGFISSIFVHSVCWTLYFND